MNYTKGSWYIEENDENEEIGPYRIESQSVTIAGDVSGIGIEAQANASLISAAPDMYEALKQALKIIEAEPEACGIYKANAQLIKNAILKAEGRTEE